MQDIDSDSAEPARRSAPDAQTSLSEFLGYWGAQLDQTVGSNNFSRALNADVKVADRPDLGQNDGMPLLSVLVRTQGKRPDNLREALTCLAAQTCDDFEIKLLVHSAPERIDQVRDLVGEFNEDFSSRIEVVGVQGGQRGRPLNVGIEESCGELIAFLDDDDVVAGDWIEAFKEAHVPGSPQIIRSVTVTQKVQVPAESEAMAAYRPTSGLENVFASTFDLGYHFYTSQTPICSVAVPRLLIDAFHLRFDEDLLVTEDWEFLIRAAQIAGVKDTERVTSVYRRWVDGQGSAGEVDQSAWDAVRLSILQRMDQVPLLLPKGSASKLAEAGDNTVGVQILNLNIAYLRQELENAQEQLDILRAERSKSEPRQGLGRRLPRRLPGYLRKWLGGLKR